MTKAVIEMKRISKTFPGVKALDDISIDFFPGNVHVLVGENGAGKSTLIKILSGIYKLEEGELLVNGNITIFDNPKQAIDAGIAVIHQELSVIDDLTVAENIFLGREHLFKKSNMLINKEKMNKKAESVLTSLSMKICPSEYVKNLSTAKKQMVEIAKAVSQNASVIVMDEPTSSISDNEVESLFKIIRKLKNDNVVIIYISHRMKELFTIGDKVTVLRDGKHIKTTEINSVKEEELITLMVGREIKKLFSVREHNLGNTILEIKKLSKKNKYSNISLKVREGEVLGIAGLIGAGRTEVLYGVFGVESPDSGEIILDGNIIDIQSPSKAIKLKIGLVPEDRRSQGLLLDDYVKTNISLPSIKFNTKRGIVDRIWENTLANSFVTKMGIKTPSINNKVKNLSGGNQQKIVLAKWMASNTRVLLLDEPTRGVDVKAKAEIYELINEFVSNGGCVIMVSSELPEILGTCDRVVVMREGEISGVMDIKEASEEGLMKLASIN